MGRWQLWCPQCGWKSLQTVSEAVKNRFLKEVMFCLECKKHGRPQVRFEAREVVQIFTTGSKQ